MNAKAPRIKSIAEYDIFMNQKLGEGGFGEVYVAQNTKKKERVAIKFIHKNKNHDKTYQLASLKNQVRLLRTAESRHVVSYKDILTTKNFYYIVQELCDYDLQTYLNKKGTLSEQETIDIVTQILKGFYQLIVHGIVHRDLKPVNILFKDGVAKIADFGLAKKICEGTKLLETRVGTSCYQSPQVFCGKRYTYKCDIWGLGVIMYELLYGRLLFCGKEPMILQAHKKIEELVFPDHPKVSPQMLTVIKKCLRYTEQDRADWSYLFNHPLFKGKVPNIDHLEQNLNYIICTIRNEIHNANVNLDGVFQRFKKQGTDEIKKEAFCKILLLLVGENKITYEDMTYAFRRFDTNSNGKISLEEFLETLQKHGVARKGLNTNQREIQSKIYTISDESDKKQEQQNESYSEKELKQIQKTEKVYRKIMDSLLVERLEKMKEKYDLEDLRGSGLDKEIFSSLMADIVPSITEEECDLMFEKFDDNKDGSISFEQFNKYVCQVAGLPFRITEHALFSNFE